LHEQKLNYNWLNIVQLFCLCKVYNYYNKQLLYNSFARVRTHSTQNVFPTGIHRPLRHLILQRGIIGQSLSDTHSRKASNVLEPDTIFIRKMESNRITAKINFGVLAISFPLYI